MSEKRYAKWRAFPQRCRERRRAETGREWHVREDPETPSQSATSSAARRERSPTLEYAGGRVPRSGEGVSPRPREERRRVILRPNPEVVFYDPETAVSTARDDGSPTRSPERSPSPSKGEQKRGKGKKCQKGKKGNSKGKKGGKGKHSGS